MNVGDLVTWTIDHEEALVKSKTINPDLEVGIIVFEKKKDDLNPIHNQKSMVGVCWVNTGRSASQYSVGWVPIDSLRLVSKEI